MARDIALLIVGLLAAQLAAFELRDWIEPGRYLREPAVLGAGLLSSILFAALLDQGAVLEEGGWRAYATPLLQGRGTSPLRVAVIVWPAIAVHGLANDAMGFSGLVNIEQALTPFHQITKAIPFAFIALALVALGGASLGRRPAAAADRG